MLAILFAAADGTQVAPLANLRPPPMLPVLDKPFVSHVVEYLVDRGFTEFHFVLSHLPEILENHLGDGSRWGSRFHFHLAKDPLRPYDILRALDIPFDRPVLVAHADVLPDIQPRVETLEAPEAGVVLWDLDSEKGADEAGAVSGSAWSGWCLLRAHDFSKMPPGLDRDRFAAWLLGGGGSSTRALTVGKWMDVRSFDGLLKANVDAAAGVWADLLRGGREAEPGVRLSRNVVLHPTAILEAPLFVGENTRVGAGVRLGPGAVVGRDCVLDDRCSVTHSVVFPSSYVGENLELDHAIVDRSCLVNVRVGTAISVREDFILGSIGRREKRRRPGGLLSRAAAVLVFLVGLAPLLGTWLALALFRKGRAVHRRRVVGTPCDLGEMDAHLFTLPSFCGCADGPEGRDGLGGRCSPGWRHLFFHLFPALPSVISGKAGLVGAPCRTGEEILDLPADWRSLHLGSKGGVITECLLFCGPSDGDDERYAADAYYAVKGSVGRDARLAWAYCLSLVGVRRGKVL